MCSRPYRPLGLPIYVARVPAAPFTQALFGKVESVLIVCAILIVVVGIALYWLRLKAERGLIRVIRSARERRQAQKPATNTDSSETVPHCPICNALMIKRLARRGSRTGSTFWVAAIIPSVEARERTDYFSIAPLIFRRCSGGGK
jgi:hypothetical protein